MRGPGWLLNISQLLLCLSSIYFKPWKIVYTLENKFDWKCSSNVIEMSLRLIIIILHEDPNPQKMWLCEIWQWSSGLMKGYHQNFLVCTYIYHIYSQIGRVAARYCNGLQIILCSLWHLVTKVLRRKQNVIWHLEKSVEKLCS